MPAVATVDAGRDGVAGPGPRHRPHMDAVADRPKHELVAVCAYPRMINLMFKAKSMRWLAVYGDAVVGVNEQSLRDRLYHWCLPVCALNNCIELAALPSIAAAGQQ